MSEAQNVDSSDDWGSASAQYAARAESITRPIASDLISWTHSKSPLSAPSAVALDNGCGTGVLTTTLSTRFPNLPIAAVDISPGMIDIVALKKLPRVKTCVLDATNLTAFEEDSFSHVLSTFMLQFTSDPLRALKEMYRVTKFRGKGTFALGMWGEMCFEAPWEETCRKFEPDYVYPKMWTPDWSDERKIKSFLENVGFKEIEIRSIRAPWNFESTEAYCEYFFESKNPYFERALVPWRTGDGGKMGAARSMCEQIVREKYNGARDFDMEVFLFTAKK